ncbi:hypothetical protein BYT27DRAFT_7127826 [Phlegmacium glaucopus]|nr:hypothetical protein BYT27DRAFT_7127826 [Phlegmacium glaucopus]
MSLGSGILVLVAIWCTIYLLYYFTSHRYSSILPTNYQLPYSPRRIRVSLHALHLKISTTSWNTYHDKLSSFLARRGTHRINSLFKLTYDIGTVFGALGIVVVVMALFWICTSSAWTLLQKLSLARDGTGTSDIMKRAVPELETSKPLHVSSLEITPIIPGVTVPLAHLPIILVAVFLSQIFHEFGHILAAARESIPMIDAGASFTICIPIAFVTFSVAGLKTLRPQARSRITAAGPFHNLVLWVFLALVTRLGLFSLASFVSGYRHISDVGQVVISVDAGSPLYLHLSPGAIITKLDDTEIGEKNASTDMWTKYLTGATQDISIGWCLARNTLKKSASCCNSSSTKESPFTCFISVEQDDRGCVDPLPILTRSTSARCTSTKDCPTDSKCVTPDKRSQLMRLTVRPSLAGIDDETVVVWSGSRREVWEEVQVGNWLPRLWILPLWLPPLLDIFWQYLTMATLSLYFFNLLPLPHLDGTELLLSILDSLFERKQEDPFVYDVEALEAEDTPETMRIRRRWKQRLGKIIPIMTMSIFICCIILGMMNILF